MLINSENLIGIKAEHEAAPLNEHKVNDILFNKYDHRLCYLTFTEEEPAHVEVSGRQDFPDDGNMENIYAATDGYGASSTPMTGTAFPEAKQTYTKETFFIPWHNISEMNDEKIVFTGNERQKEEPQECYSYRAVKDWHVVDQSGEKIGRIKDLILDTNRQQVIGFALSEGFWKSMFGADDKYMPITGQPDWQTQEWRIEQTPDLILKNSPEDL